ncbi:MAG TPA: hypothetical protein VGF30_07600 [Bacteroidia bacterium]
MKNFTLKSIATAVVAIAMVFTSCKKGDTGPQGAAGTNGSNGVVQSYTDGYIKGNVVGTREDNTAFNEAFEYTTYYEGAAGILDSNGTNNFDFRISRSKDVFGENSASITVNTTSKTATSGTLTFNNFSLVKALNSTQRFEFTTNGSPSVTVTNLSYNTSTRVFTGSFSVSYLGIQNSTGNSATISGSFQATMVQLYNLVKNNNGITTLKD